MEDSILSPDGKSEWTGSEWVPVGTQTQHTSGANVYTQQKIVDSVIMGNLTSQTIVQNSPEDMAKAMVLALEQIGFVGNIQTSNPSNQQMSNVKNLLKAGDELTSRGVKIQGSTDLKLGNAARLTGRYQAAMEYYQRALDTFRAESNRSGEADAMINIGYLALNQGDAPKAYSVFRDAQAMKLELGDKNGEADVILAMANLALIGNEYDQAQHLFSQALKIKEEHSDENGVAIALIGIGNILESKKDYQAAQLHYRQGLIIKRKQKDLEGEAIILANLATVAEHLGNTSDAQRLTNESVAIKRQIGDRRGEAFSHIQLASQAKTRGDLVEAERLYKMALKMKKKLCLMLENSMS